MHIPQDISVRDWDISKSLRGDILVAKVVSMHQYDAKARYQSVECRVFCTSRRIEFNSIVEAPVHVHVSFILSISNG